MMKRFYFYESQFDFGENRVVFFTTLVLLLMVYLFTCYLKKSKKLASD